MDATDVRAALATYPRIVLSWRDATGRPRSLRCSVAPDAGGTAVRLELAGALDVPAAPASLLGHFHDARLWNQTSVLVRGRVETRDGATVFVPAMLVPGIRQGLGPFLRFVIESRKRTAAYLAERNMPRPTVPWDALAALRDRGLAAG